MELIDELWANYTTNSTLSVKLWNLCEIPKVCLRLTKHLIRILELKTNRIGIENKSFKIVMLKKVTDCIKMI